MTKDEIINEIESKTKEIVELGKQLGKNDEDRENFTFVSAFAKPDDGDVQALFSGFGMSNNTVYMLFKYMDDRDLIPSFLDILSESIGNQKTTMQ